MYYIQSHNNKYMFLFASFDFELNSLYNFVKKIHLQYIDIKIIAGIFTQTFANKTGFNFSLYVRVQKGNNM